MNEVKVEIERRESGLDNSPTEIRFVWGMAQQLHFGVQLANKKIFGSRRG